MTVFARARASFIGAADRRLSEEGDPAIVYRREFTVDPGLRSAALHVTALGIVEAYLNGTRTDDCVLEPGWTSYRHRLTYRTHDVSALVREGVNALGAVVGEGWATGRLGYGSVARRRIYAERVSLAAVLELHYDDRVEYVVTDEHFRTASGEVRANSLYDGATIDRTHVPSGWAMPGFDDSLWPPAEVVHRDLDTLEPATAEPIRRTARLSPVSITQTAAGTTLVDFGQIISGWVRLRVSGSRGARIVVRHAEVVVGGLPDYETLRNAKATDTFVLAGDGVEEFEPTFTFHGFRYAEFDGLPGPLAYEDVSAVVVHTDMRRTGTFTCSDETLNRLHENVVWSMRGNFVGLPTDCPQRDERLGWTGDINAFGPTAVLLYDVRGILGSWLDDVAAEQTAGGFVPFVVPDILPGRDDPTALWGDVAVSLPWALYQEYGDPQILNRQYRSMTAFVDDVAARLDGDGRWSRGFQWGDWLDPDAPPHNPMAAKTDRHLVATAFFARVAGELAAAARVLGRHHDAGRYSALAEQVRAAFRAEYVTERGRIANETITAYALAIEFGLLTDAQLLVAGRRLADLVRARKHRISTGFAGTPHVAAALARAGYVEDAYRLLLQPDPPGFTYPVSIGATTVWERWDAILPDGTVNSTGMTSLNHYALGAVARWFYSAIVGLEATTPGWTTFRVRPLPGGGLTHAAATHDTMSGRIAAAWRLADGTMHLQVDVPTDATAEVNLPLHPQSAVHHVGAGRHEWSYMATPSGGQLTLDSLTDDVAADDCAWDAVAAVVAQHVPHTPPTIVRAVGGGRPLGEALADVPGTTPTLIADVAAALDTPNTREDHP